MERMSWNLQGLANLVDTFGLGVGLGSARVSSFIVTLLANLGLPGTLLYGLFVWGVFQAPAGDSPPDGDEARLRHAFRHAFAAALCAAAVSATVFDRGPAFYLYAAAAGVVWRRSGVPAAVRRPASSHRPPARAGSSLGLR
jgi:hypothetical protein